LLSTLKIKILITIRPTHNISREGNENYAVLMLIDVFLEVINNLE